MTYVRTRVNNLIVIHLLVILAVKVMARFSGSCEDIRGTFRSLATQCVCV